MRAVGGPGRWVWGLSGLATAAVLLVPSVRVLTAAGGPWHRQPTPDTVVRSLTVPEHVTSLDVQSYGGLVKVAAGPVSRVEVIETISYAKQEGGLPAVVQSVSAGRLTLAAPACATSDCTVGFAVTMPAGIPATVTTDGSAAAVSGTAGADVDSGGAPVTAEHIDGALTVSTDGGALQLTATAGPLRADTGGGPLSDQGADAATADVSTDGGSARIAFSAAPDTVLLSTEGGPVTLTVPGGPYALAADSEGGPQSVGIGTDPAARRSITVTSGGGSLQIGPAPGH